MKNNRRQMLKTAVAGLAGAAAAQVPAAAQTSGLVKKVHYKGPKPTKPQLFSNAVSYGNLLFIAGKGAHFEGDIKAHTKPFVLDDLQKELENAGSSLKYLKKPVVMVRFPGESHEVIAYI